MKDVGVFAKGISLQYSWIKRLYDENFHKLKIIPSYLIKTIFCGNVEFHLCLEPSIRLLKKVPNFYKEMITNWEKCLLCSPYLPSAILSQFLWFNSNVKINKKSIFISGFASKNIDLLVRFFMKMARLNHGIILNQHLPKLWKDCILSCIGNSINLRIFDHHLRKKNKMEYMEL